MRVRIFSNARELVLSPFVGKFTGGVCRAVCGALKAPQPSGQIRIDLEGERVGIRIDGALVVMDERQGFAGTIVCDTLRGMTKHLKGMDPDGVIRIEVDLEENRGQSQT